jgi:hypothetical protein
MTPIAPSAVDCPARPWSRGRPKTTWNSSTATPSTSGAPGATELRGQPINSGHHVAEDNPDDLVEALLAHLAPLRDLHP